jgi:PhnB protein
MKITRAVRLPEDQPPHPATARHQKTKGAAMKDSTPPAPYLHFPGTAREALAFYAGVFGGSAQLHTFAEFNRTDGPGDAIAHGYLNDSPIELYAADVAGDQRPLRTEGLMLSLLGTAEPPTLREWFARLADGGQVVDDLQVRPWGATDGQVLDRYGLLWLIGFEHED